MAIEYTEQEMIKRDEYLDKKEAARLLYLARKALCDIKEQHDSREISTAITKCEEAIMWIDYSVIVQHLECEL